MPGIESIASAAGGLDLGEILNPAADLVENTFWNTASAKQSQKQWDDSMRLATHQMGSRYQMAMADMRKAGLNPILAAGGLSGNTSGMPSGKAMQTQRTNFAGKHSAQAQASAAKKLADSQYELNKEKESEIAENIHLIHEKAENERTVIRDSIREQGKLNSANQATAVENAIAQHLENYQRAAQKWLYQGKKGKFIGFLDYLRKYIPFTSGTKSTTTHK